jgi:hypothetical protein
MLLPMSQSAQAHRVHPFLFLGLDGATTLLRALNRRKKLTAAQESSYQLE